MKSPYAAEIISNKLKQKLTIAQGIAKDLSMVYHLLAQCAPLMRVQSLPASFLMYL